MRIASWGLSVPQANILAPGYSKGHVEDCLQERFGSEKTLLQGIFVNSTISLEGVVRWLSQVGLTGSEQPPMGCFDWDPFVYLLGHDIDMVQQDVPGDAGRCFFRLLTPAKPASSGLKFPRD
ncbi:ribitol operon repressor [Klebsiella pneumoniae]|nr:ribitol operon repressor [Klebsiella pneumoniae]